MSCYPSAPQTEQGWGGWTLTIDLGFNYFVTKTSVPADTSCNLNCTGIDNVVYNPYAGLDVETSVHAYVMALTYQTVF